MPNGGWSNAEEVAVLRWYFENTPKTPPASLWVGLCDAEPNDDGTFSEITYTDYARQQMVAGDWGGAVGGDPSYIANINDVTFDVSDSAAGTATHFVLMDNETASSAINMRFSGKIVQPPNGLVISIGTQPQFDNGALRAQLGSESP